MLPRYALPDGASTLRSNSVELAAQTNFTLRQIAHDQWEWFKRALTGLEGILAAIDSIRVRRFGEKSAQALRWSR